MADTFESRTITVRIARPRPEVYDFTSAPENFPRWASGLARSLKNVDGEWIADTPEGPVKVRFTGSEVIFTLFRLPGMTDEAFARDAEWVERDLRALKALLEG